MLRRVLPFVPPLLLLVAWELAATRGWVSRVLVSSPSAVVRSAGPLLARSEVHTDVGITLSAVGLAFGLACAVGVPLGLLTGRSVLAARLVSPWLVALTSVPKVALMPLVLMWLGMGLSARVALAVLMAAFPIITAAEAAIRAVEPDYLLLARACRAPPLVLMWEILLPALAPHLLGGMRVGLNQALVGVLIVEFFASGSGVGYRMALLGANFQVAGFFVLLLAVMAASVLGNVALARVERRVGAWRSA